MKLFGWILAALLLVGAGIAEWRLLADLGSQLRDSGVREDRAVPYAISLSGGALQNRVKEDLAAINTARMARIDKGLGDAVVVEGVTYERNGGVVRAEGKVRDLGNGRRVLAVMDAYDADMGYLTSAAVPVQTAKGVPTAFAVAMPDRVDLSTLSFRVLSEADKSEILSLTERDLQKRRSDVEDRATLLLDDSVQPIDLQEAEERLRRLGYVTSPSEVAVGEPAMNVVFARFRKDHGLPRSSGTDLETFLAIRLVTPDFRPRYRADL
jgi:hypothetical protein